MIRTGRPQLTVSGVTLRFGGVTSLDDVCLSQQAGQVVAVIGPNGAGKTSLFNCLTGVYRPESGSIRLAAVEGDPMELVGRKPHRIARAGIARTFQNIRLFEALTALENVKIAVETHQRAGAVRSMLRTPLVRREDRESDEAAMRLLGFVGLGSRANDVAASLPYGSQRRLEIARALATRPRLLLLDEPAAGANAAEKESLAELIRRVSDSGVTVLLIEHDVRLVMSLTDHVVVLNFGKVIAAGTPAEVRRDPAVIEAYLGRAEGDEASAEGESA